MKKVLIFSLFAIGIISSCQKAGVNQNTGYFPPLDTTTNNNTPPPASSSTYYLRANIDGTVRTFNVAAFAVEQSSAGLTALVIAGLATSNSNGESLSITVNNSGNSKPIVAGTYTENETDGYLAAANYNPGGMTIIWGTGLVYDTINPLKVTISAIDATTVKGTFSGNLYYVNTVTDSIGGAWKTFSNGEFNVKF